ncbi:c-type cytochrome [Sulfitobacter pontiacus]|uniref:c-type cytochrome n=1 Tax=Sulfitobacter pontiacus TaxID=60137 RepID=UPI003D6620AB
MKHAILALCMIFPAVTSAQDASQGQTIFQFHCATCHGLEATGNGPMAGALLVQPTNLTQLTAKNDGDFPITRVIMRIDGRDPLVSHGSSMPIFGTFFEGYDVALRTETGQPIMTSKPIVDLMAYLETLQEK